jgi:hypothetical protein
LVIKVPATPRLFVMLFKVASYHEMKHKCNLGAVPAVTGPQLISVPVVAEFVAEDKNTGGPTVPSLVLPPPDDATGFNPATNEGERNPVCDSATMAIKARMLISIRFMLVLL